MNTCPKCGRHYTAPPATSRENGEDICPVCGAEEAIAVLPEDKRMEIIKTIEAAERAAGRID